MTIHALIQTEFNHSVETKQRTLEVLNESLIRSAECLINTLKSHHKIMICGNGGSAADAQHFAAELSNRYETERAPLAGLALTTDSSAITAIGNDFGYQYVFQKQVQALGKPGDCLVAISTSGQSESIINAVNTALENNISVIALSGKDGGLFKNIQHPNFIELRIPSTSTARIQETHILIIHIWCKLIDQAYLETI